ncbi:MAG: Uma2 family endonuclease [Peptococcaceae bacterium]|nr:Uma2 family endonuclease [Peptococcaceae bacterium]
MKMTVVNPHVKFTYEDYCLMPEDRRYELIGGEFFLVPSPSVIHQRISANLEAILRDFVRRQDCGEVLYAPLDVVLSPQDVVQPDIMYISRERSHIVTDNNIQGAPDLVVEILSPSTAERDRTIKKKLYARHGVRELWLVNAGAQVVEVYSLAEGEEVPPLLYARSDRRPLLSPLLEGLQVNLDQVF